MRLHPVLLLLLPLALLLIPAPIPVHAAAAATSVGGADASRATAAPSGVRFRTDVRRRGGGTTVTTWEWLSSGPRVMYHHPDRGVSEVWTRTPDGRVRLERVFHAAARGIAYEPSDLAAIDDEIDWNRVGMPFDPSILEKLTRRRERGEGRDRVEVHRGRIGERRWVVEWLPALDHPRELVVRGPQGTVRTTAERELTSEEAAARWRAVERADCMDFADIGDNEADPFVAWLLEHEMVEHGEPTGAWSYPAHAH